MKKILITILFLMSIISFANGAKLNMTLGHTDKLDLHGIPSTLYVEDPEVLDYEFHKPNWLLIKAKGVGQTKLYAIDDSGAINKSYVISVHYPVALLESIIHNLFPAAKLKFKSIPKHLLVEGSAPSLQVYKGILSQIYANVPKAQVVDKIKYPEIVANTPSRQINLRVRIVEVTRSVSKALGIHWDLLSKNKIGDNHSFKFSGPQQVDYFSLGGTVSNTFSTVLQNDLFSLGAFIDLLEDDNFATTVQEPNLTVKAGEEASFSVGGSVPVYRSADSTLVNNSVGYQDYGIDLKYKAEFDEDDPKLIKLSVTPSVSNVIQKANNNNPDITRKKAQTVVELRSGQSIAIAGLVSSTTSSQKSAVPGLSTMPVFGEAFRSEDYSRVETEIVFIITPYIVHATQNGMLEDSMDNTGMPKSSALNSGFVVGDEDE